MINNTFKIVAAALNDNVERVVAYLFPNGKKEGNYWVTGNVFDTPATGGGSFKIGLKGKYLGICRDFNGDDKSYDLIDAWALRFSLNKSEALNEAAKFLSLPQDIPVKKESATTKIKKPAENIQKPINQNWNQKLVSRLRSNPLALEYLHKRSLTNETIQEFKLGLTHPYTNRDGVVLSDALAVPIRKVDGSFSSHHAFYAIEGVTKNPVDRNGWMKGKPQVYFTHAFRKQKKLIVCEGIKDAWVVYQNLKKNDLLSQFLVCSGTHGSSIPDEMKNPNFWTKFEKIYFGHDHDSAGNRMAEKLSEFVPLECYRLVCPSHYAPVKYNSDGSEKPENEWGADWTDFFLLDGCIEEFLSLIEDAPVISIDIQEEEDTLSEGRFTVAPVDINGAYINKKMYYPVQTLVRQKQTDDYQNTFFVERYETVVVRSDATVHKAVLSPAPKGTPESERVIRLSDGTLIRSAPKPNEFGTWNWSSINDYLNDRSNVRKTADIFKDVYQILKKSVWLPVEEDYTILALTVLATYIQNIFESVPLLFLNGPAGSGKSQTGIIMSKLSCNGTVIGQVSAATAARHIDAARGFVVFDDLEGIASKAGRDGGQFSELVQALKVSYNKHTAEKIWTDVKTMRTERLNFFGIKLISNTSGADDILSTRMLRIQTRHMPETEQGNIHKFGVNEFKRIEKLRQELHTWAFKNCVFIDDLAAQSNEKSGRFDEIALPLRVIAKLVSNECEKELEIALAKQKTVVVETNDPIETLKEAAKNLIKEGFIQFTITQVILELRTLLDENYGAGMTNEIPEWQRPEWVGRQLRTLGLLDTKDLGRASLFGKRLKIMQFNEYAINEVVQELGATINDFREPFDFCKGCQTCPYANSTCELRPQRLQQEQKAKSNYS